MGHASAGFGMRMRAVVDGLFGVWLRKIGDGDLMADTRGLLVPVGEGGLAGEDGSGLRVQRERKCNCHR